MSGESNGWSMDRLDHLKRVIEDDIRRERYWGAVTTLTRTLAAELGPRKVRVNAVAPGSVPTPATVGFVDEAEYERRARTIPLRRLGQTGDNNQAVAFLLSREASFITGTVLHVDGGIVAAG